MPARRQPARAGRLPKPCPIEGELQIDHASNPLMPQIILSQHGCLQNRDVFNKWRLVSRSELFYQLISSKRPGKPVNFCRFADSRKGCVYPSHLSFAAERLGWLETELH